MHFFKLFSLIFFMTLVSHIRQASAVCCSCNKYFCDHFRVCEFRCDDGTPCTFYCGYGRCNIFGCNCDGGCRAKEFSEPPPQSTIAPSPWSALEDGFVELFKAADLNHDDLLTFGEWISTVSIHAALGQSVLLAHWNKFVSEGKDYLTREEAMLRLA
ncbi:hypothetical protein BD779DRAFT_877728 [Infundibulicybe gibba]|nr:hypothetical protein BD779DRAFT_877728 [Infundibulicybe gibba]